MRKIDMLGVIGISHQAIACIIGIHPHEREQAQTIFVDVKLKVDFSACIKTDAIDSTVDYVQVAALCTQLAQEKKYHLLEAFAHDILDHLIHKFHAKWAWVCIKKPQAIPMAAYAFVELERHLED